MYYRILSVWRRGRPGQKPRLSFAYPLLRAGYILGHPGVQDLPTSVCQGNDSGQLTYIWWEDPGSQKLAQNCPEENSHGTFLLIFPDIFSLVYLLDLFPTLKTEHVRPPCRSWLPGRRPVVTYKAGTGAPVRGAACSSPA